MIRRRISPALLMVMAPQFALAQELPAWTLAEICANASAPGQCALFEGRARNAVSGSWEVLPDAVKRTCLAAVKSPLDQSWRLLIDCIDTETLKAVHRRAAATAATPAEPVPAREPAEPANRAPAPNSSVPLEPPKTP
jgi:hypothetical protein